ncbi:unnamed protein product [Rotaria sordida]|nr:unnamed protein product [Rotaria sordida]CAF1387093.1 unnamed protein product [Rotaria sordida]
MDIPFTIFSTNSSQNSVRDLSEDNKAFLWHQFMLDVLLNIPHSPTPTQDTIRGCHLVNDYDGKNSIELKQNDIDLFQTTYTPDKAIYWFDYS